MKKESINTVYIPKKGYQWICKSVDHNGELIWELEMKEPWHSKMFPVRYGGDFSEQWMWLTLMEKGLEWDKPETIDDQFSRHSKKLLRRIMDADKRKR